MLGSDRLLNELKNKYKFLRYLLLGITLVWTLFPIYWMITIAIRSESELSSKLGILPKSITFEHLSNIFIEEKFTSAIINSFSVTIISLLISLALGISCAYILARSRFKIRMKIPLLLWILLVRILPPITFALPLYIIMNNFGILHTKIPIILVHILINIPFIIWFMMSFFTSIPVELEESAKVDGASEWILYLKIILPLVLPGIAAVTIFSFMTSWNEYLYGVIFVQSPSNFTIPLKLATLNSEQELIEWGKVASGGIISMIPVMLAAVFMQKYLIKGLTAGSVKE